MAMTRFVLDADSVFRVIVFRLSINVSYFVLLTLPVCTKRIHVVIWEVTP
jgi:hypothetical protein